MAIVQNFGYSATVPVVPATAAVNGSFPSLTVQYYFEDPNARFVKARFIELNYEITLWEGDAYDAIASNWTDADVLARLQELFPS